MALPGTLSGVSASTEAPCVHWRSLEPVRTWIIPMFPMAKSLVSALLASIAEEPKQPKFSKIYCPPKHKFGDLQGEYILNYDKLLIFGDFNVHICCVFILIKCL